MRASKRLAEEIEKLYSALNRLEARVDRELADVAHRQGLVISELDSFRLDYQGLYEKVRMNLAKLAKRAEEPKPNEPSGAEGGDLARYRRMLAEKKLSQG